MPIQGPKGTRDFYPEDMAFQQFMFDSWHKSCRLYGFEQYEGPMFEHLDLYTQKSGDEIEKQLYSFEDKGGRTIALRPELTPTLARMAAAKGTNLKRPVRWYSICRLFRYERMQKGRLREFIQLNMDILGIEDVSADAELIAAAVDMMRAFGFDDTDFKARVSSRTMLEELFLLCGVERDQLKPLYALLDKKGKMSGDDFSRELEGIVNKEDIRGKINDMFNCGCIDDIERFAGTLGSSPPQIASLDQLKKLFALIDSYGLSDYLVFDIGIVRGLAYYTGIVFELFDVRGNLRAIAGGGRYDNLVGLYGGPPTPAAGFAAGDVVLGELLKSKSLAPPPPPRSDVFLISIDSGASAAIINTAQQLRAAGISCEFSLKDNQNVGKQLKSADSARSRCALFIGGDEAKNGQFRLKNLITGKEELINISEIDRVLRGMF
ncbi:MAG: histidine--tRNA ligase [Chitinispirillia bacterium]|nr:histidine--tRNA ligase [Chitinispirillia bacterium]MCL2269596.1 histidine--tRNA ligase [Chitinispirillia bacterium]